MLLLRISSLFVVFVAVTSGQTAKTQLPTAAPISCTSEVPQHLCKVSTFVFSNLQKFGTSMRQVEVVITDKKGLEQEKDRVGTTYLNALKVSASKIERNRPTLPNFLDDYMLFEIDRLGFVAKVFLSSELFNKIEDASGKDGKVSTQGMGEFDIDSIVRGSYFVLGYVDGCFNSRLHTVSEDLEVANDRK